MTGISWTDETWNPVRGCSRVSEGCRHCYAEQQAARIVRMGRGKPTAYDGLVRVVRGDSMSNPPVSVEPRWTGKVVLDAAKLAQPLRWRKGRRIFVNSMSDLFHESLTNEQIAAVFGVMAACPQHTFQVLTKRARRMREWFAWLDGQTSHGNGRGDTHAEACRAAALVAREWRAPDGSMPPTGMQLLGYDSRWPLPNVWLGVSVENQGAADERIPELLATPAAVRFLSIEPMLGPVDLTKVGLRRTDNGIGMQSWEKVDALHGARWVQSHGGPWIWNGLRGPRIDWAIAGCESGPGARPCDVAWLRALRGQCARAVVPFFLKQAVMSDDTMDASITLGPGSRRKPGGVIELPYLDGVQHAAFPRSEHR